MSKAGPQASNGDLQQLNKKLPNSGLDYLANIASIAQSSPQYVLDKNIIKAEIANQAALAARTYGQPPVLTTQHLKALDGEQKLNQLIFENLLLGSHMQAT